MRIARRSGDPDRAWPVPVRAVTLPVAPAGVGRLVDSDGTRIPHGARRGVRTACQCRSGREAMFVSGPMSCPGGRAAGSAAGGIRYDHCRAAASSVSRSDPGLGARRRARQRRIPGEGVTESNACRGHSERLGWLHARDRPLGRRRPLGRPGPESDSDFLSCRVFDNFYWRRWRCRFPSSIT